MRSDALLWGWGGVRDEAPPLHRFDGGCWPHSLLPIYGRGGWSQRVNFSPASPSLCPIYGGGAEPMMIFYGWGVGHSRSHSPPLPIYGTGEEAVRVGGATLPGPFMVKGRGQCE